MRILVADDDRVVVHLVAGLLRSKGHEVVPVFDAMQAFMFAMPPPAPTPSSSTSTCPAGPGSKP